MTQQYDNTGKGALWGNDKKLTDNHPDFKGSINIDGREYWLSGWKRAQGGNPNAPALKLSAQLKEAPAVAGITPLTQQQPQYQQNQQQAQQPSQNQQQPNPNKVPPPKPSGFEDFDDDIPF